MANQTIDFGPIYKVFAFVGSSLAGIGFASNLVLSYTLLIDKFFRKVSYKLMLICIISDAFASFALFFGYAVILEQIDHVNAASSACKILLFLVYVSYGISFMNLALIAVDRYFAVVRPLSSFYRFYKNRILFVSETCILILASIVGIPVTFQMDIHTGNNQLCDVSNITAVTSAFMIVSPTVRFIIPSVIIIICYWRITTHQCNYIRPGQLSRGQLDLRIKKRKYIRALMSISTFNVINTWPITAFYIAQAITRKSVDDMRKENPFLFILGLISVSIISNISVVNPFIYMKFDRNIRLKVMKNLKSAWALLSFSRYRSKTSHIIAIQQ